MAEQKESKVMLKTGTVSARRSDAAGGQQVQQGHLSQGFVPPILQPTRQPPTVRPKSEAHGRGGGQR